MGAGHWQYCSTTASMLTLGKRVNSISNTIDICFCAGTSLLGAGYCLYSSSTVLVLTLGNGVNGFTYDSNVGEFILSHPDVQIPEQGAIYSFNEGNYQVCGPSAM